MSTKRQKTIPSDKRMAAVDAALRLASGRDFVNVTLTDIADEAGITLGDMSEMFECREDIICAYERRVDKDVLESFSSSGSERDQIFDILMERFDRLNQDRAAVVSILGSVRADPKQMVISLPHVGRSMAWMLEACGIETIGIKGALRVAGLSGIYLWTLRTWCEDDSEDMAKTMATLDKLLGRAESIAGTLSL